MKNTLGLIFISLVLTGFIGLQKTVLSRVLKEKEDLTLVSGIIKSVEIIKNPKRFIGYNFAYGLKVDSSDLMFAIKEDNYNAYEYISRNNIINKRLTILYDENGYNSNENLTYHIYSVRIGNKTILDIRESRESDIYGLISFLIADIFIIWMIIYVYKKNQKLY